LKSLIVLLLTLNLSTTISAKPVEVPIEAYGKLPTKSMLVVSPSGNRIAFRDTSTDKDLLIVLDLQGGKIIAGTELKEINPTSMYFVDEQKLILVATDNMILRGFRGRHDVSAAFAFNLDKNKVHQIMVAGDGVYTGQSELGNIVGVSADKKYAFIPAWQNENVKSLFKVNLEKRRTPKRYKRGTSDAIDFFLGHDGEVLARERYNNNNDTHRIEAYVDGKWQEIYKEVTPIRTKGFYGVSPDRKHLFMKGFNRKTRRWAYYTMALADGTISEPIFAKEDRDVEYVLTDINRVVYGVKYSGFTPSYEFFDNKLNARMRGINKALPNNAFTIQDYTPDWSSIVLYMDGDSSSGDYMLYNGGNLASLTSERPDIPAQAVNKVEQYEFTARDGLTIPTLLTKPNGKPLEKLPAIILPHGGPESYDTIGFDWMAQYFASQGYLVVQPQFRGSDGFGQAHLQLGHGEWGRKMQDDLTDAVVHLVEKGAVDSERVCIVGASYGGYAALAGAAFTPDLYKCAVSINGVSDVQRMLKQERRDYGKDHWVVSYWEDLIANGEVEKDHLRAISPINHVSQISVPVLLIHGEHDEIVPIKQSEIMFDELEDLDKPAEFIELEEGDHHLSKGKNRLKALKAMAKFIDAHI
jgi:dipeptidyl aminopeptidase/acylaminoacyl peptidase